MLFVAVDNCDRFVHLSKQELRGLIILPCCQAAFIFLGRLLPAAPARVAAPVDSARALQELSGHPCGFASLSVCLHALHHLHPLDLCGTSRQQLTVAHRNLESGFGRRPRKQRDALPLVAPAAATPSDLVAAFEKPAFDPQSRVRFLTPRKLHFEIQKGLTTNRGAKAVAAIPNRHAKLSVGDVVDGRALRPQLLVESTSAPTHRRVVANPVVALARGFSQLLGLAKDQGHADFAAPEIPRPLSGPTELVG